MNYKANKLYYFIHDNAICSGYVIGVKNSSVISIGNLVLSEKITVQLKTVKKTKIDYIEVSKEHVFESLNDLVRSQTGETNEEEGFSWYQKVSMSKTYGAGTPIVYPALKLNGEAGKVAEKVGKVLRDENGVFTEDKKIELMKELGDVLWYVTAIATDMGYNLSDVAKMNVEKILDRRARKVVAGSGDNR